MRRSDIITEARCWIGTRWQHQASLRGVATDCIGLVAGVALALGSAEAHAFMSDPTMRAYGRQPDPQMLLRLATELLDPIALDTAQPGDVLLMRFATEPQHFGFLSTLAPACMIHAYAGARRVVEHGIDVAWQRRIVRAFALRGVTA